MDLEDIDDILDEFFEAIESAVFDSIGNEEIEHQEEIMNFSESDSSDSDPPRLFQPSPVSSTSSLDGSFDPLSGLLDFTRHAANLLMGTGENSFLGNLIEATSNLFLGDPRPDSDLFETGDRDGRPSDPWLITPEPNPINPQPLPVIAAFYILILIICNQDNPSDFFEEESS